MAASNESEKAVNHQVLSMIYGFLFFVESR